MKLKVEYIVLGAIIVGIALFLILRTGNRVQYELPEIAEVDSESISRIAIEGPEETIELERSGDGWSILPQGYPADGAKIDEMATSIADLTLTAMVSESQRYSRYDLDDSSRLRITAYDGGGTSLRTIDVGKQGSSRRSSFVLVPGDKRVFTTSKDLRNVFDKEVDKLRDMVVMSFDTSQITEISGRRGSEALVLTKSETEEDGEARTEWKTPDGVVWETEAVDRVLRSLSNLRCSEYLGEGDTVDPETLSLTLKGEKGYTLSLHGERDTKRVALSSESEYPFLLSSYQVSDVEEIFTSPESEGTEG
jgi:hypothetical protein